MGYSLVPRLKAKLVKDYIGNEVYERLDKQTRYIMIKYALQDFRNDLIKKFGSIYKYQLFRINRLGFKSMGGYRKYLLELNGFKSETEYMNFLANKNGFDTIGKMNYFKSGYKKRVDRIDNGFCSVCGEKTKEGYKVCEIHYEKEKNRISNKREQINSYFRIYSKSDKRKIWEKQRYQSNILKFREYNKLQARKYRKQNPEKFRLRNRLWKKENYPSKYVRGSNQYVRVLRNPKLNSEEVVSIPPQP